MSDKEKEHNDFSKVPSGPETEVKPIDYAGNYIDNARKQINEDVEKIFKDQLDHKFKKSKKIQLLTDWRFWTLIAIFVSGYIFVLAKY